MWKGLLCVVSVPVVSVPVVSVPNLEGTNSIPDSCH